MLKIIPDVITEFEPTADIQPLPDDVVEECTKLIYRARVKNVPMRAYETFPWFDLAMGVNWKWIAPGGTLLRRVQKWYNEQFSENLPYMTIEQIHNVIRTRVPKQKKYYIEFTQDLDWQAGDFGDGGSCFFGIRNIVRDEMQKDGRFWAVRFYTESRNYGKRVDYMDNEHLYGHARALFTLEYIKINRTVTLPYMVIFNGHTIPTDKIAQIVSAYFHMPFKWMDTTNNKKATGGIYLNDGSYIVAPQKALNGISNYDFGMKTKYHFDGFENTIEDGPGRVSGNIKERNIRFMKDGVIRVNSQGTPLIRPVKKIKVKRKSNTMMANLLKRWRHQNGPAELAGFQI